MDISTDTDQDELRARFQFVTGPRFEVFYAMQTMLEDGPVHENWRRRALEQLPESFFEANERLGSAAKIWALVADAPGAVDPGIGFDALLERIGRLDLDVFRRGMLVGVLHDQDRVHDLLQGRKDLATVIATAPEIRRDRWFSCIGLYPFDEEAPLARALQRLVDDAAGFRRDALHCLKLFWDHVFSSTWDGLRSHLERSMQESRRLFEATTVEQYLERSLLCLKTDDEHRRLRALRGGCEIPYDRLYAIYIMPSVFNVSRMWTTYDETTAGSVYLCVVDPAIAVDADLIRGQSAGASVETDPALIFKALGDGTRYAMLQLIGRQPRSSTDLARELKVSKATISHHLSLLREAGLVGEEAAAGAVRLSLRREVIDDLSSLAAGAFGAVAANENDPPA